MTWLDEDEKIFVPPHCPIDARKAGRRMVRVIRELAIVIDKYRQSEGYALFRIYTSDCSDDAKEVLG